MSLYQTRFKTVLVEKDEEITDDQLAMQQTLDKGSQLSDFDANTPNTHFDTHSMGGVAKKMHGELARWIQELDKFSELLNGTGPNSIQTKLNAAEADTLFDKISIAETKKIARVAVEVSSLAEMMKGYLATANDPKYRYS